MPEPLEGYYNIHQAVRVCDLAAEEARASREASERSPFGGVNLGRPPADVLRRALESGAILAAGVSESDGKLVTIPARLWRTHFRRELPLRPRWVASDGFSQEPARRTPPKLEPFSEAANGQTIPALKSEFGVGFAWLIPIIAQADLARWMGEDPPAEPLERPTDWPQPSRSETAATVGAARSELVRLFVRGYSQALADAGLPPMKRDDKGLIELARVAVPGCLVDEVRAAFSALPEGLRNPSPKEKNAKRTSARR